MLDKHISYYQQNVNEKSDAAVASLFSFGKAREN